MSTLNAADIAAIVAAVLAAKPARAKRAPGVKSPTMTIAERRAQAKGGECPFHGDAPRKFATANGFATHYCPNRPAAE